MRQDRTRDRERFGQVAAITALLALMPALLMADDWPQWLGPERDGVWREEGIVEQFPQDGPKVRWRTKIGAGYAGPAVAEDRVYVMDRLLDENADVPADPFQRGRIPGKERVVCLDDEDGKILWTHEYDCPYTISYPSGPRVTPVVRDGKVYSLGAEGDLFCLNAEDGKVVWSRNFKKDYNAETPMWGFSAHPLLDGNRLICMVGGPGSVVVAFDKDTGKELWRALDAKEPGYCPPVIFEAGGVRQLIVWHAEAVVSLNPKTGETYWSQPIAAKYGMSIGTPRKLGDKLFVMSFPDESMMLTLDANKPDADILWRGQAKTGVYGIMATPYLEDGYIYAPDTDGEFRCVEMQTGNRIWETYAPTTGKRRARWGNVFLIKHAPSGHFFLFNEQGDLIIADLSPEGYKEIDRTHLLEPTGAAGGRNVLWSHPAFAHHSIYARNDNELLRASLTADAE